MNELPVTGAVAEYRGARYRIVFGTAEWVALQADRDAVIPDAFARGERQLAPTGTEQWAKVPMAVVDGVIDVRVKGTVQGEAVSLQRQLPDGRVRVGFVGSPSAARKLGLEGDQYQGWTGLFNSDDFSDIQVKESRRA